MKKLELEFDNRELGQVYEKTVLTLNLAEAATSLWYSTEKNVDTDSKVRLMENYPIRIFCSLPD